MRQRRQERRRIMRSVCHYCGSPGRMTQDHIVPRSRGGLDLSWNIVPACESCNTTKRTEWPTCECLTCRSAVARQPWAWTGPMEDKPRRLPGYPSRAERATLAKCT